MMSLKVAWPIFKKFIKNYWQLILGLSVAVLFLLIKRDGKLLAGALSLFREEEKNRRTLMLELSKEENSKKKKALSDYEKKLASLKEKADKKRTLFKIGRQKKIEELLDAEEKSPGTIAKEIDEAVDRD